LDQSYYYMIEDTTYRDRTQVVSRWNIAPNRPKPKRPSRYPESRFGNFRSNRESKLNMRVGRDVKHNILMVDQLWLWVIPDSENHFFNIITCFPSREGSTPSNVDDLQQNVLDDRHYDLFLDKKQLVSRILSLCLNALDPNQAEESLQFLKFFESAVGNAEEEESRLFRKFRHDAKKLYSLHEGTRYPYIIIPLPYL